jgi:hypothetical protein
VLCDLAGVRSPISILSGFRVSFLARRCVTFRFTTEETNSGVSRQNVVLYLLIYVVLSPEILGGMTWGLFGSIVFLKNVVLYLLIYVVV